MMRAPDLSGRVLDGRYELESLIGEGAFGRVYRGRDRRLDRAVAVKVIKPWWAEDPVWVGRFEREVQLLARATDPGVVQIFDVGEAEEGLYYVAELVVGESLAERLRRGPVSREAGLDIAEQLARALGRAHAQRVVHRDVKPANVLVRSDGQVKVGDFGVARLAEAEGAGGPDTVVGTPRYMAPEQAAGRGATPASDVYAVGAVLYEMLTGRPPFLERSAAEVAGRHEGDGPPTLGGGVPGILVAIVDRALAPDPGDRYPDGTAMAEAVREAREALAGEPGATEATEATWTPSTAGASPNGGGVRDPVWPAEDMAGRPSGPAGTQVAPRGPGRAPPPSRRGPRRARIAAVAVSLGVAIAGLVAVLLGGGGRTVVPELLGLPRGGVVARAQREHVRPAFTTAYSVARTGVAIAQDPRAGTSVGDGATVRVVLSKGPPPVSVPGVVGLGISAARSRLGAVGLHTRTTLVAGGGRTPGTVTRQEPSTGSLAGAGSTVSLSVARTPRWHAVTSFAGTGDAGSVAFRIRGSRWEVTYSMDYQGTCTLLIVCFGPSATARSVGTNSAVGTFDLSKGTGHAHVFESGPGLYMVTVSAGHDAARWSMQVRDYY